MFQCDDATEASSMISLRFVFTQILYLYLYLQILQILYLQDFHLSCWFFTTIPSDWGPV